MMDPHRQPHAHSPTHESPLTVFFSVSSRTRSKHSPTAASIYQEGACKSNLSNFHDFTIVVVAMVETIGRLRRRAQSGEASERPKSNSLSRPLRTSGVRSRLQRRGHHGRASAVRRSTLHPATANSINVRSRSIRSKHSMELGSFLDSLGWWSAGAPACASCVVRCALCGAGLGWSGISYPCNVRDICVRAS